MGQILKTDPISGAIESIDVGNNVSMNRHIMFALKNSISGSIDLAVNAASAAQFFYLQPPITEIYTLKRMNIRIIANSFLNALRYGGVGTGAGLVAGLPNGLRVFVERGNVTVGSGNLVIDYTADRKIKVTSDWALLAGVDANPESGTFDDPFTVRWTFAKSCGHIILDGSAYERLVVEVNDDISSLESHINMVSGTTKTII